MVNWSVTAVSMKVMGINSTKVESGVEIVGTREECRQSD